MDRTPEPLISLIVPVFNERDAVPIFVDEVDRRLGRAGHRIEFLFIDDGSDDDTLDVISQIADGRVDIRCISLSRNFGKEAALSAGIDHARGDVVIPIDVDLQDPPEVVVHFLEKWREGYDVVFGVRSDRRADTSTKRKTAGSFYRFFNRMSSIPIPENAGDFRLMDKRVVEVVKQLPERNRFMKGIFSWVGFRSIGVAYERAERSSGESKWNYWKLWNFALDGITSFSTVPLRGWTYIGLLLALFSLVYSAVIVVRVLVFGIDVPGYASLMTVLLFFSGIQLITLGVIGEYIGRLFIESKARPIYVIDRVIEKSQP